MTRAHRYTRTCIRTHANTIRIHTLLESDFITEAVSRILPMKSVLFCFDSVHPFLFTNKTYQDPVHKFPWNNPWESAAITFAGKRTARDFQNDRLADR